MFRSANSWMLLTEPDSGEINNVSLSIPGNPCFPLKIKTNISRPVAVNYDPLEGKIYWADSSLKLVARAYPDGSSTDVTLDGVFTGVISEPIRLKLRVWMAHIEQLLSTRVLNVQWL